MKVQVHTVKLARIGNSRGIRLPRKLLEKYGIGEQVLLEVRPDRIVLRAVEEDRKLSWQETFAEMSASDEDWSDWEGSVGDGIDKL